jgi:hypothetical protein
LDRLVSFLGFSFVHPVCQQLHGGLCMHGGVLRVDLAALALVSACAKSTTAQQPSMEARLAHSKQDESQQRDD